MIRRASVRSVSEFASSPRRAQSAPARSWLARRSGRSRSALPRGRLRARSPSTIGGNRLVRTALVKTTNLRAKAAVARRKRRDQRNRHLALGQIVAGRLAERAFVGDNVEQIVLHLKRDAEASPNSRNAATSSVRFRRP